MKYFKLLFGLMFFLNTALAQNTITGQVVANDPQGFLIIGCLIDLATSDCNYEKSQSATVNQDSTYILSNLEPGQYIMIAWRDTNGSGDLEEGQDEIGYYTDANGEVSLITAPASNINITVGNSAATNPLTTNPPDTANNPLSTTQAPNSNSIIGTWNKGYASSSSYQDSITGILAPPSGGGWNYTFNAEGSYVHTFLFQNTFYSCTTTIFNYEEGTYVAQDGVLMLTQTQNHTKSDDSCSASGNYEKDYPLETEYFFFQFTREVLDGVDYGERLELTDLILNSQGTLEVDPEDSTPLSLSRE